MKKGQSSVEYILIVAFSLLIIIPSTFLFLNYSSDSKVAVVSSQIYKLGNELIVSAEEIYSVGTNSWQTINILIPEEVNKLTIYNGTTSELVINYGDPGSEVVFFTKIQIFDNSFNADCTTGCELPIHAGPNSIRIKSTTNNNKDIVTYEVVK